MKLEHAKLAIDRYSENRIPPGDFLMAVLSNDLKGALQKADPESLENIKAIFGHIWNDLPQNIWGSHEAVKSHLTGEKTPAPENPENNPAGERVGQKIAEVLGLEPDRNGLYKTGRGQQSAEGLAQTVIDLIRD